MPKYAKFFGNMPVERDPAVAAAAEDAALEKARQNDKKSLAAGRLLGLAVLGPAVPVIDPSKPEQLKKVNDEHRGEMAAYGEMVTDGLGYNAPEDVAYASLCKNLPRMRQQMAQRTGAEMPAEREHTELATAA